MAGQNVDVGDVVVTQIVCSQPSEQQVAITNRFWEVTALAGTGDVSFNDIAGAMEALVATNLLVLLQNDARYEGVRVRRVYPPNNDQWAASTALADNGSAGATGLASQTCGLIQFKGPFLGKHAEGRMYIPFPSTSSNQGTGVPTSTYQANAATFAAPLVVPHTISGSGSRTAALSPGLWDRVNSRLTQITQTTPSTSWATQRRRGMYGRTNKLPF